MEYTQSQFPEVLPRRARCGCKSLALLSLLIGSGLVVLFSSVTSAQEPTNAMSFALRGPRAAPLVQGARAMPLAMNPRMATSRQAPNVGAMPEVTTEVRGTEGEASFRRFFLSGGKEISPWHDLPLRTDAANEFTMVTEIPKMTKPKMESATKEAMNPIAQDEKKGKLRDYHGPIFWNYGFLPKTWEDPTVEHPELKAFGDNDPVDVVEIGSRANGQGEISTVKVLGTLAMIDDGELDWKVIAINTDDPMAKELNDVPDVDAKMPGTISGIREWFRWYKTPDGKPLNGFGFDEVALGKDKTLEIIDETNQAYERLKAGKVESKLWTGEPAK